MLKKKVFLDFDGVLVDSAFEAFRVAASTISAISSPFDNTRDDMYHEFLVYRKVVAPAWNYYYVIRDLFDEGGFKEPWLHTHEAKSFENRFISERNRIRKYDRQKWLSLHKTYFDLAWLDQFGCIDIVTNKPKDAVKDLLEMNGCPCLASRIYDREDWPDGSRKSSFIEKIYQNESLDSAIFVDDHTDTILEMNRLASLDVSSYQALWGYSDRCENVNSISEDEFKPLLLDYIE